ncbi:hypothetical protein ZIOFF_035042 [Zingiber officinale]|uniref:PTM/DIR17-like Tudor domain-containing protein n=1 Tax=Zingiber officinale TaxID=94328 RepID=A0A8J5G8A3_ZINOF|nr:hypothetical protein ZIOFF_035042 [Zingiber officinale]
MEPESNGQELEHAVVSEMIGEPAIIIDGVPPLPPDSVKICGEASTHVGSTFDPCFGEWLEGRKVHKLFGDHYFSGIVVKYDSESNWYRVIYEDGDSEDLEWHELEEILLPLDISIPLTTLALQRCNSNLSDSMPHITSVIMGKGTKKG